MQSQDDLLLDLMILIEQDCPRYDLINKYVCPALRRFLDLGLPSGGRAIYLFANGMPERLENRLKQIQEHSSIILGRIFNEAGLGKIPNADELDRRLTNIWAELRTVTQLLREGFADIRKHDDHYDFDASQDGIECAVQTVRVNSKFVFPKLTGEVPRIRKNLLQGVLTLDDEQGQPLQRPKSVEDIFWERVRDKNSDFAKVNAPLLRRRLVIATSEGEFSDNYLRYCVCQMLMGFLEFPETRHIDEICWLPDLGNGYLVSHTQDRLRSYIGVNIRETASTLDEPTSCKWNEISLDKEYPSRDFR